MVNPAVAQKSTQPANQVMGPGKKDVPVVDDPVMNNTPGGPPVIAEKDTTITPDPDCLGASSKEPNKGMLQI